MDIRIGMANVARELHVEIDDKDASGLADDVDKVTSGKLGTLWVTDKNGRRVGVPAKVLAYVEFGPSGDRRVGFASD